MIFQKRTQTIRQKPCILTKSWASKMAYLANSPIVTMLYVPWLQWNNYVQLGAKYPHLVAIGHGHHSKGIFKICDYHPLRSRTNAIRLSQVPYL